MHQVPSILISGITGFVGSNLSPFLASHYNIQGVSRSGGKDFLNYSSLTKLDLDSAKAFIHLAGKAHDLKKTSLEKEYFEVNTELTKNLFDLFLKSKCEIFVFLSSVKAVADTVEEVLSEDTVPKPFTAYGQSKLRAEQYLLSQPLPENKKVYILRPAMIHGPNNKGNLNLLYQVVKNNIPYPLGAFDNRRSFVTVDNLSFIIKELIAGKPESGVYNIADDQAISTTELVRLIGKTSGKKTRVYALPPKLVSLVAKTGDRLNLPFNTERLNKLTENFVVSNKKIKEVLSKDLPYDTVSGLKKTIQSFAVKP